MGNADGTPTLKNLSALIAATLCLLSACYVPASAISDSKAYTLAKRFRPYYKFSSEQGESSERYRPCSWQWFVRHSSLKRADVVIFSNESLKKDPWLILTKSDSDIRSTIDPKHPYELAIDEEMLEGEDWNSVAKRGCGMYAQVEQFDSNTIVISYWTLFARNEVKSGLAKFLGANHNGDISNVTVVYDIPSDQLTRASFSLHGTIIESFNLVNPKLTRESNVWEKTFDGQKKFNTIRTLVIDNDQNHCYRDFKGNMLETVAAGYSPASEPTVSFCAEAGKNRFEHIVVYPEWGSHEPWPSKEGSVNALPDHNGEAESFLPKHVIFLGSGDRPKLYQAPFLFFNGKWGDPPSITFHKTFFYKNGFANNPFGIKDADENMPDRDPYHEGTLSWPPPK